MLRLMHMQPTAGLLLAVAVAVAIAGCGANSAGADNNEAGSPGRPERLDAETVVSVGDTVNFALLTHCGVESTTFNGRVWNAVQPLYSSPWKLGPPAGWDDPYQEGELTLESRDRAVFAALGERVVLMPSGTGEPLRPCD